MEKLKAKLKKQGGFTMVELLIVVAIIAILVAISIPMMNSVLERSRHAVDQANIRDAIGLISVEYSLSPDDFETENAYYYCVDENTHQGYLSKDDTEAATPECTCGIADTTALVVSLQASGTAEKPTIKTSWEFTGGKTQATTDAKKPATPT